MSTPRSQAYEVMSTAFQRLRTQNPSVSVDELLNRITRPPSIPIRDWGMVFQKFGPYARALRIVQAEVSPSRDTDPDTAQVAALINKQLRSRQRVDVLKALVAAGDVGATDYELSEVCFGANGKKILRTSAGKRRKELVEVHLAMITDERRETDTTTPAVVWKVTPLGVQVAAEFDSRTI